MPKKLIDSKAKTKMWRKSIKVIVFELTHRKTKTNTNIQITYTYMYTVKDEDDQEAFTR